MQEKKKDVLRETDEEAIRLARTLLRSSRYGAIAVLDPQTGAPMASRVAVATDHDGAPTRRLEAPMVHDRHRDDERPERPHADLEPRRAATQEDQGALGVDGRRGCREDGEKRHHRGGLILHLRLWSK